MKSVVAIEIPRKIESNNKFVRAHWRHYQKYKSSWFEVLGWMLRSRPTPPDRKMRLVITSKRKNILDDDNLRGGAKPIPDALKKLNIIRDDSPKWLEAEYHQEISPIESTTIEVFQTEERPIESQSGKRVMEQDRRPRRR